MKRDSQYLLKKLFILIRDIPLRLFSKVIKRVNKK